MRRPVILTCIDGAGTDYFKSCSLPNISRLCKEGICSWNSYAMVPTVTNVNNVSIVTGRYPAEHGIFTNCYYEVEGDREVYMESPEMIRSETIFEKASRLGLKSAVITVKDKLRTLLSRGVDYSFSAEKPARWTVDRIGRPPDIYSSEVNLWIFKCAEIVIEELSPDVLYIATTDYVMHKHPPESPEAHRHMQLLDEGIGLLLDRRPDSVIGITADHGMNAKKTAVDLEKVLAEKGIEAKAIPTVKDRYLPHHSNLSGSAYVYLKRPREVDEAYDILKDAEGVEEVIPATEASLRFHLPREKVGKLLILGKVDYVFGNLPSSTVENVDLRSHGSLHERVVPTIVYGVGGLKEKIVENRLLAQIVLKTIGIKDF